MKIGVSSYSFVRLVRTEALAQKAVIGRAREMGFDAIEFSTIALPPGTTLPEFAVELRDEAERVGIEIINYTIGADFLKGSGGDLEAEIRRVQDEVDIAAILGVPGMRHDVSTGWPADHVGPPSFAAALPRLAEGCRRVSAYAAEKGITTMVENHGWFCQESSCIEALVTAVNHPNFGVLLDVGNFLCADEEPAQAVGRLLPYVTHCHVKDFHVKAGHEPFPTPGWFESRGGAYLRGAMLGHGNVPVLPCLKLLARAGYQGAVSLEYEGIEDVLMAVQAGHDTLRHYVSLLHGRSNA